MVSVRWLLPAVLAIGCEIEPLGQVHVWVDTDLDVPNLASRLRADIYDDQGTWLATNDWPLTTPDRWPAEFTLYVEKDAARSVVVRLRAYLDNERRAYVGPAVASGKTPSDEPDPALAVDRLIAFSIAPRAIRNVQVVLRGACAGTPADLAHATSCLDEATPSAAAPVPLAEGRGAPSPVAKAFGHELETPCERPLRAARPGWLEEDVCVKGGAFVFGIGDNAMRFDTDMVDLPKRIVRVSSFVVDAHEVTVARMREAFASGKIPSVTYSALQIGDDNPDFSNGFKSCVYSARNEAQALPDNCLEPQLMAVFCAIDGGTLPSEVEFEYMATMARHEKRHYPWGNDPLTCDRAVFGRLKGSAYFCGAYGPQPLSNDSLDVSPDHVYDLAGSMSEVTRDVYTSLGSRCWRDAPSIDPTCAGSGPTTARGGNWTNLPQYAGPWARFAIGVTEYSSQIGFRCVRR